MNEQSYTDLMVNDRLGRTIGFFTGVLVPPASGDFNPPVDIRGGVRFLERSCMVKLASLVCDMASNGRVWCLSAR